MENKNQPAFPPNAGWESSEAKGLTKLEYASMMAMQGMLASGMSTNMDKIANDAVAIANELLVQIKESLEDDAFNAAVQDS